MDNAYNIPNLRGHSTACRTNLPSNTAFRGFGVPQTMTVVENMVNDVAMVLGRPADQVRGSGVVERSGALDVFDWSEIRYPPCTKVKRESSF